MQILLKLGRGAVAAALISAVVACAGTSHTDSTDLTRVAVTDFAEVAGMWEGNLFQASRRRVDDWLQLLIHDDGSYEFRTVRTIGVFSGKGRFVLTDGTLTVQDDRRTVSIDHYRGHGQDDELLRAKGVSAEGLAYRADLTRKKASSSR